MQTNGGCVKPTAEESADLKMALKRDPETPELRAAADSLEGDEAHAEVTEGRDYAVPGSVIANELSPVR
jgi:hypothetical protein